LTSNGRGPSARRGTVGDALTWRGSFGGRLFVTGCRGDVSAGSAPRADEHNHDGMASMRVLVAGAGIFGVTAAVELAKRGHRVMLVDPGPIPHPLAESTDISKLVRADYGADDDYTRLGAESTRIWREWNDLFGETLFHETGLLFLTQGPLEERPFERESFERAVEMGYQPERLSPDVLRKRFPAWNADRYVDGYFNPAGGWTMSGKVVTALVAYAKSLGAELREGVTLQGLIENGSRVEGIVTTSGERIEADIVLVAAGQWTPHLLPFTKPFFRSTGQPVWWLKPNDPALFDAKRFPGFGADISTTGWYGFPLHPEEGVVKIANHGVGREMDPDSPERIVTEDETARLREFLTGSLPSLAQASIVNTRVCLYCDTWDGHFWIDHDPERPGLVLATGGSGHGLKFAPVLGPLIADVVGRKSNPYAPKFRWRPEVRGKNEEEARHKARS